MATEGPTKAAFRRFTRGYARPLADDLGLRDWTLTIQRTDEDESRQGSEVIATCYPTYGRKHAEITLHPPFWALTPEDQKHALIHEFIHCHLAALQHQVEHDLKDHFSDSAYAAFFDSFRRNLEYAIDGLAAEIARLSKGIPDPDIG